MAFLKKRWRTAILFAQAAALALSLAPPLGVTAAERNPYNASGIINVELPININFTIDPLELGGMGQIYSESFAVRNFGQTNVYFSIMDVSLNFSNYWDFQPLAMPFDDYMQTDMKAIYMSMDFNRDYMPPIVLTDPYYPKYATAPLDSPALTPGGAYDPMRCALEFSFSGSVNAAPANGWKRGDVTVVVTYNIEALIPEGYYSEPPPIPAETPIPTLPPGPPVEIPTQGPPVEIPTPGPEPTPDPVPSEPIDTYEPGSESPEPIYSPEPAEDPAGLG
ncbi:MAG: hypothetical protein LBS19_13250 [Clostridiales bacterium]|nr:hypothetical protein [Clostridiales bacterium]